MYHGDRSVFMSICWFIAHQVRQLGGMSCLLISSTRVTPYSDLEKVVEEA